MKHSAPAKRGHGRSGGDTSLMGALHGFSERLDKFIEGLLVALAAVVVLEWSAEVSTATLALIGSTFALFAGTFYGELIQHEIETRQSPTAAELKGVALDASPILLGAMPALAVLLLAWAGLIGTELALTVAVWGGIGLLGTIGYGAARLREAPSFAAVLHGVSLALIGIVVLGIKTLH